MSVIQFRIPDENGGDVQFADLAEAILWAKEQEQSWKTSFAHLIGSSPKNPINYVLLAWARAIGELQEKYAEKRHVALTIHPDPGLIVFQSPVFESIKWVYENLDYESFLGAATAAGLPHKIVWTQPKQVEGLILYERMLKQIVSRGSDENEYLLSTKFREIDSSASRLQEALEVLEKKNLENEKIVTSAVDNVNRFEKEVLSRIESLRNKFDVSINDVNNYLDSILSASEASVKDFANKSKDDVENWCLSFKEQRQLEAPVVLWKSRASEHFTTMDVRKWWMIAIGIVGFAAVFLVSFMAFKLAGVVVQDAVLPPLNGKVSAINGLRPTFQTEIVISAASTLLFITMYLWSMRILVRLYTSEHYLAIDAEGRAALTETYLSLTREGAATDADRAIMLGVIFRPVWDGMGKEEGPPAISPAAIISGWVAPAKTA